MEKVNVIFEIFLITKEGMHVLMKVFVSNGGTTLRQKMENKTNKRIIKNGRLAEDLKRKLCT